MPVEIRELNIRVNLTDGGGNQNASSSSSGGDAGASGEAQEAIVEAVVAKVLELLKDKMER
jgi:Family of unknown function (DUF5908)